MNSKKTLIFTATYIEKENISKLLDLIISLKLETDIYIIDDNSPDKTYETLKNYSEKYFFIKYKVRPNKLGYSTVIKRSSV